MELKYTIYAINDGKGGWGGFRHYPRSKIAVLRTNTDNFELEVR